MDYRFKLLALNLMPASMRRRVMERRYLAEIADTGEPEMPHLSKFVPNGRVALDIGANLGAYSYALSRLAPRVIAFEPNPVLAGFLRRLRVPNVEVQEIALSSEDGEAELTEPLGFGGHGRSSLRGDLNLDWRRRRVRVGTRSLDGMGLTDVGFIKIDVEGFEEEAIAGAMGLISRDKPVLLIEIEERHNQGGLERITERLVPIGYAVFFLLNGRWHPIEDFRLDTHQIGDAELERKLLTMRRRDVTYVNNFLFLPKPAGIESLN